MLRNSVTEVPGVTRVPPAGSVPATAPTGWSEATPVWLTVAVSPTAARAAVAASTEEPATSGTVTRTPLRILSVVWPNCSTG
jgi:hypothetical protein